MHRFNSLNLYLQQGDRSMKKPSLFFVALLALVCAPSCRNLRFWRKDNPVTAEVETKKQKKVKEKDRVSGAQGWGIDVEKE